MPVASYQCSSARRIVPSAKRTLATPFRFLHRPRPYALQFADLPAGGERLDITDLAADLKIHMPSSPRQCPLSNCLSNGVAVIRVPQPGADASQAAIIPASDAFPRWSAVSFIPLMLATYDYAASSGGRKPRSLRASVLSHWRGLGIAIAGA